MSEAYYNLGELLEFYKDKAVILVITGGFKIYGTIIGLSRYRDCVEIHHNHSNKISLIPLCHIITVGCDDNGENFLNNVEEIGKYISDYGIPGHCIEIVNKAKDAIGKPTSIEIVTTVGENHVERIKNVAPGLIFTDDDIYVAAHIVDLAIGIENDNY